MAEPYEFSTKDYRKRTVVLESYRFKKHICIGHPEMASNLHSIKKTIEDPEVVYESEFDSNREIFFCRVSISTYPQLYTKAVVDYSDPEMGKVISSWFEPKITGVEKEGLLYVKSPGK